MAIIWNGKLVKAAQLQLLQLKRLQLYKKKGRLLPPFEVKHSL
jgi:hypothetical protein